MAALATVLHRPDFRPDPPPDFWARLTPTAGCLTADQVLGLTTTSLLQRYDDPKPIPDLHYEMWALCCSPALQVAIAAPRGHAKSTAITFAYALALLLFRESRHLLIMSSSETVAIDFLNDIRVELRENDRLHRMFGEVTFQRERDTEIICQMPDGHRFRVLVKGVGQRMRGLKWERKRPDTVIGDDMEDDEIVLNPDRRDKFRRWFYGAVRPIVKSGGRIRLVGTIIHMDALLERTMPPAGDPETVVEPLRTWSAKDRAWLAVKYRAHDEGFVNLLWPGQFTAERLREIHREYAEMGLLDVYGQEYLNDPIDQSTAFFRRQDFLPMEKGDHERRKEYYAAADFAISLNKASAYTCLVVGGMDEDGTLHVVDVRRGRWDSTEIIEEMFLVQERYQIALFRVESENIEKSLGPILYREMDERGIYIALDPKTPTKDKKQRAQALQRRMRAGKVRFNREAEWYADYEEELAHFPKWKTLDQVDASAWLGLMLSDMINAQTNKEVEDEEYDIAYAATAYQGASAVTGY